MGIIMSVLGLVFRCLTFLVEIACWLAHGISQALTIGRDFKAARARFVEGVLTCPDGHPIPLEGGTYVCTSCGYTYQGSILRCANAECGAITSYINCGECGLSVRNPYRWGRP